MSELIAGTKKNNIVFRLRSKDETLKYLKYIMLNKINLLI